MNSSDFGNKVASSNCDSPSSILPQSKFQIPSAPDSVSLNCTNSIRQRGDGRRRCWCCGDSPFRRCPCKPIPHFRLARLCSCSVPQTFHYLVGLLFFFSFNIVGIFLHQVVVWIFDNVRWDSIIFRVLLQNTYWTRYCPRYYVLLLAIWSTAS